MVKYWLGISKLSTTKNKLNITSEDGFHICINLDDGEKFLYNKCIETLTLNVIDVEITKKRGSGQTKSIMGFASFMSNLGLLLKKHIINNKIKKYDLNDFYSNIFNLIKKILGD